MRGHKPKVRDSYGIALIYPTENVGDRLKILLVKKRCSHYFCAFVNGKYAPDDDVRLRAMFDNMTVCEKTYILGGNFDDIWVKRWLHHPICKYSVFNYYEGAEQMKTTAEHFGKCEKKYHELHNSGRLFRLVEGTRSISGIWEIPKGKRKTARMDGIEETPLECATREFHEEVDIAPTDYAFLSDHPVSFSLEDDGVKYNMHIYLCVLKNMDWRPRISFGKISFFTEIDDIAWFSHGAITNLNISEKQLSFLLDQYHVISRKYHNLRTAPLKNE